MVGVLLFLLNKDFFHGKRAFNEWKNNGKILDSNPHSTNTLKTADKILSFWNAADK